MRIYKELMSGLRKIATSIGIKIRYKEELQGLKGHVFIKAFEKGKLVYDWDMGNVIVNTTSILIARLLKSGSGSLNGITYLAMGTGGDDWDLQDPPAPTTGQVLLESEIFRAAVASTAFIDGDGAVSTSPTNIVDYTFNFSESDAVGTLVELGLFGGDATITLESGTMVNYRTFPVLNKTASMAFTVVIRITA